MTQWALAIVPSLLVALVMLYVQRQTTQTDKWKDALQNKVEGHDKDLVRLDTTVTLVREHMEQIRGDVKKTRELVERLWGAVDHNPGVFGRARRDTNDA